MENKCQDCEQPLIVQQTSREELKEGTSTCESDGYDSQYFNSVMGSQAQIDTGVSEA